MWDFIGLIFIFVVAYLVYRFVLNKHRKIVDREPNIELAENQLKTVKGSTILAVNRPASDLIGVPVNYGDK